MRSTNLCMCKRDTNSITIKSPIVLCYCGTCYAIFTSVVLVVSLNVVCPSDQ